MLLGDRKLKAVTGFVLVQSEEQEAGETISKGGIILLHEKNQNKWVKGKIHSAGRQAKFGKNGRVEKTFDAPVREGDVIMYRKYETEIIRFDDAILYRIPYERVRFTLEDE